MLHQWKSHQLKHILQSLSGTTLLSLSFSSPYNYLGGSYFHVSPAAVAAYYFEILAVMDHDVTAQISVEGDMMPTAQGELLTRQAGQVLDKLLNRLVSLTLDLCHDGLQ